MRSHGLLEDLTGLLDVTLMQSREDGALVGKVLVHRTNADPRRLSDAVGGDGIDTFKPQHPLNRVENNFNRLPRTFLLRRAANAGSLVSDLHVCRPSRSSTTGAFVAPLMLKLNNKTWQKFETTKEEHVVLALTPDADNIRYGYAVIYEMVEPRRTSRGSMPRSQNTNLTESNPSPQAALRLVERLWSEQPRRAKRLDVERLIYGLRERRVGKPLAQVTRLLKKAGNKTLSSGAAR